MSVYRPSEFDGGCMRIMPGGFEDGHECGRRAERRCDHLELCAEHAAEWLADRRKNAARQRELVALAEDWGDRNVRRAS